MGAENLLGTLLVRMALDAADFAGGVEQAENKLSAAGSRMGALGGKLSVGVTLPLLGAATAATAFATDFNASMANVQSLGVPLARVTELKDSVQDMAIATGKSTEDLAGGLYEVVSAFGDSADSALILQSNAKAAAAGLATTTDAIKLTAAVTKGYGDSSAAAVQQVADLAFQTVNLGQTTFPELAANMGKVVPIAAALGVSQQELFAQMATLTGVTGNAAEVSTQLRATYQAILAPSDEMAKQLSGIATQLERQGKLADSGLVDSWRAATATLQAGEAAVMAAKQQLQALEAQMSTAGSQAATLKDAIAAQRLETDRQRLALQQQLAATDTTTEAGKAQAAAIRDQIGALELASKARLNELQGQLLAQGNNAALAATYKDLEKQIKDLEKGQEKQLKTVDNAAAALGGAVVQSTSLTDVLGMLNTQAGGNTSTLQKMFGSVEALNAVLALSGPQADSFKSKLGAMADASGAVDDAFAAQTKGINATGFSMAQVAVKTTVLMQKLGDGLAPALGKLLDIAAPFVDKLIEMAEWFASTDSNTQTLIVSALALVAALGPVLGVVGMVTSGLAGLGGILGAVGSAFGAAGAMGAIWAALSGAVVGAASAIGAAIAAIGWPITLIVAAIAGLVLAWNTDFLGLRTMILGWVDQIGAAWPGFVDGLIATWQGLVTWAQEGFGSLGAIWDGMITGLQTAWQGFVDWLTGAIGRAGDAAGSAWAGLTGGLQAGWESMTDGLQQTWQTFVDWLPPEVRAAGNAAQSAWQGALDGMAIAAQGATTRIQQGWSGLLAFMAADTPTKLATVRSIWQASTEHMVQIAANQWQSIRLSWESNLALIRGIAKAATQFMSGDWQGGLNTLRDTASTIWDNIKSIFGLQLDNIQQAFTAVGWGDLGKAIVDGIANGIRNFGGSIVDAARWAAQGALDAAKALLGISSPSRRAAVEIGQPFAAGVGVGILAGLPAVGAAAEVGFQRMMDNFDVQPISIDGFTAAVRQPGQRQQRGPQAPANGLGALAQRLEAVLGRLPVTNMVGATGAAGATYVTLTQNFNGNPEPVAVGAAAQDGILAALRRAGGR